MTDGACACPQAYGPTTTAATKVTCALPSECVVQPLARGRQTRAPMLGDADLDGPHWGGSGLGGFLYRVDATGIKGEVVSDLRNSGVRSLIGPYRVN